MIGGGTVKKCLTGEACKAQTAWVLTTYVPLGKLLQFSRPQFAHL